MFTTVHLHLLLNHLPIIVTGLGLLLIGLAALRADEYLGRVALWFLVGGAVSTLPTYFTGSGASRAVRNLPGVTRSLIHAHSSVADIAAIVVGLLGVYALWVLWRYRRPTHLPRIVVGITLVGALVGSA